MGAAVSAYTLVLTAIRRNGLLISSGRRWTRTQYLRALSIGRSALVAKKVANATIVAKTKVNQILAANGMYVQGKTGVYYLRRAGKWVKPAGTAAALGPISSTYKPGTVPQNFIAKQTLVKRAFIAARNRHAAAIQTQGVTDVNYTKANELAMYEIRAAGLPTDQLRISTSGTLLAGNPRVGNPRVGNPRVGNPRVGNPRVGNPQVGNPRVGNPQVGNLRVKNLQVGNPRVGNPRVGNPRVGNPRVGNPQVGNPRVGNPRVGNPRVGNPRVGNPRVGNPRVGNPRVGNPRVGDWDWGKIELQEIKSKLEPEEGDAMYDPELWIDDESEDGEKDKEKDKEKDAEDAEILKEMDEIEEEGPSFDTTEEDLWLRSEVAADYLEGRYPLMGAEVTFFNPPTATATTSYVAPTFVASPPFQRWWNTITWFRNTATPIINATTPTAAATAAAVAAAGGGSYGGGGGGGGGPTGGGGGGEGEGGEGGEEAEEAAEESEETLDERPEGEG
jgi:hypothetical protein